MRAYYPIDIELSLPLHHNNNTMDGLLAEINKKKTADFGSSGSKYVKRGEAERQKEDESAARREEQRKRKADDDDKDGDRATKLRREVR